jgi:hypothetical protein
VSIIDFDSRSGQPRKKKLGLALVASACIAGVISIGSVVAGGISLNGGGGRAEFGQGYVTTTTCDPDGIEVTPVYAYTNRSGDGSFTFSTIQVEGVSANCAGKDLIIKVYNSNGEAINITRSVENGVVTATYKEIRVHFQPFVNATVIAEDDSVPNTVLSNGSWANQFEGVGELPVFIQTLSNLFQINDDEVALGTNASLYFELDPNENAFEITFDPDAIVLDDTDVTGFADARDVYNISIQSVDHQS